MKKTILGLLALTSVVSVANYEDFHGFADVNSEVKLEGTMESDALKGPKITFDNNFNLGLYTHKDKDVFVFGGAKGLKGVFENSTATFEPEKVSYYFGARWDREIADGFSTALTLAHKQGYISEKTLLDGNKKKIHDSNILQESVVKHLKAKGTFDSSKDNDDDREDYLKDNGYYMEDAEKTTLLSGVLRGKLPKNFDFKVVGLYNSKNFEDGTHYLESYAKLSGQATDKTKVSSKVQHVITSKSYDNAGKLYGDLKLDTTFSNEFKTSNKISADLDNIKAVQNGHFATFKSENEAKYTGFTNTELTGNLNYKGELDTRGNRYLDGGKKYDLDNTVTLKLKGVFKPVSGLTLTNKLEDELTLTTKTKKTDLATANTPDYKYTKYQLSDIKNKFTTANEAKYEFSNAYVKGLLNYELKNTFMEAEEAKDTITSEHSILAGLGAGYANYGLDSKLDVRYNTNTDKKHDLFAWTTNKYETSYEGHGLAFNLDAYTAINLTKKDNAPKFVVSQLLVKAGAKYTNTLGKFNNMVGLKGEYYRFDWTNEAFNLAKAELMLETKYQANANIEVVGNVKTTYRYNDYKDILGIALEKRVTKDDKYNEDLKEILNEKEQNDYVEGNDVNKLHGLDVEPMFKLNMKFEDNKLEVLPYLGAKVSFGQNREEKFKFNKVEGKAGLTVKYNW